MQPIFEKTGVRSLSDAAFSHSGKSPTTPAARRSSGMRATPNAVSCAAAFFAGHALPPNVICPALKASKPHSTSASAPWPLPDIPAMAVICPERNCRLTPRIWWRAELPALAPSSSHTTAPVCRSLLRFVVGTLMSRPTMATASCCWVVVFVSTIATSLPDRSTATRWHTRSTSPSLWLMKTTLKPLSTIFCSVANSWSLSCGVRTAVGSSRIRIFAPRYRALTISTRWRSPTDRLPTRASGAMVKPNWLEASSSLARAAARRENGCHSGSLPSMTLSSTVRLSASVKCWCTMPMPAASAAFGSPAASGWPNTSMLPLSIM